MVSRIGIIGLGWWGRQLFEYFSEFPHVKVVAVCDKSPDALKQVNLGEATPYTDLEDFFNKEELNAYSGCDSSNCTPYSNQDGCRERDTRVL